MAYTQNEKSIGLDVLATLAAGDLFIVGDVSDTGRAKAITTTDMQATTGITQLQTDVTTLQGDMTTVQGDITVLQGDVSNLQNQINNISAGGGSGSGKPMTFSLTDFSQATGEPLSGYSDREALVYSSGATIIFQDILAYTQSRDITLDWASATGVQSYTVLGLYLYVLVTSGSVLRVYRFTTSDLSTGGTLMTFVGATLTYNANVVMTSNGTDFFFNYEAGQLADSFEIAKFTFSGTVFTYVSTVTCGATALQFAGKLAVDSSGNIYGTNAGIIYQYDNAGALQVTSGQTLASITDLFNWANTLYGSDTNSQIFTKLYMPDTDLNPIGSRFSPSTTSEFFDDFVGADWNRDIGTSTDAVGVISVGAWGITNVTAIASMDLPVGEANHPGIVNLGNSGFGYFFLGGSTTTTSTEAIGPVQIGDVYEFSGYHDLLTVAAAVGIIGLGYDFTTVAVPVIYFSWDGNANTVSGVVAGVGSTASTALAGSGWRNYKIVVSAGSVEFFLNGVSMGSVAGALPTDDIAPFIRPDNGGLGCQLDFFYFYRTLTR